jgi:3-keto-disaccharide hydrolase
MMNPQTAVLLVVLISAPAVAADKPPGQWVPLFNGKDLTGWTVKITGHALGDNYANTFRVEDGVMKVRYDNYKTFGGKFGHIFYNEKLSHYRLRVEYRFTGKQCPGGPGWAFRNSGIMLHCEAPQQMEKNQKFPTSIECQLLGGGPTGRRPTANVCTPGTNMVMNGKLITRHCTDSTSKTYRGDGWVTVEVEVRGGKTIKHIIDGKTVLAYEQPQLDDRDAHAKKLIPKDGNKLLTAGYISLQSESHPCEFRKVELMKLEATTDSGKP